MFNSKEIRWFSQDENEQISKWFRSKELFFAATVPRRDFYLPLPNKEDIGIKLREGKIEVKYRINKPKLGKLTDDTEGFYENWEKWSFGVKEGNQLSKKIIQEKKYDWIEIYKERIGLKITKNENGKIELLNIKEFISYGCQVEYTRILVKDQEWFTFGLEWFGKKYIDLDPSLIEEILGNAILKKEESMGYGRFLKTIFL
jgi:hypothetical protein